MNKLPVLRLNVIIGLSIILLILKAFFVTAHAADTQKPHANSSLITKQRARNISQSYTPLHSEAHTTKLIPYFDQEKSQWTKAWMTSFIDKSGIIPVKTGFVVLDAKNERVLNVLQLAIKKDSQFGLTRKRNVRGRQITEEKTLQIRLNIKDVLKIARSKVSKESHVYVSLLGMHKDNLCYEILFKDVKKKRTGSLWIDSDTGEIVDQYKSMPAVEYGTDNSVEEEIKRYRDPVIPIQGRSAFILGIHDGADWRDMAVLATIPAASMINNAKPVVLLGKYYNGTILLNNSVTDFLYQYAPADVYLVGGTSINETVPGTVHTVDGADLDNICVNIASHFWTDSNNVVIAQDNDYGMALLASNLAAHLYSPLLWASATGISPEAQNVISDIGAQNALLIGNIPAAVITQIQALGLNSISLSNKEEISGYIQTVIGAAIDYAVLTNPYDRDALVDANAPILPKSSLLAPALAAYHNGILYAEKYEAVKYTFSITGETAVRPNGVSDGAEKKYYSAEYSNSPPAKASGATWAGYPVNGNYFYGDIRDVERNSWDQHEFFLVASVPGALSYDRVLIDLDDSTDYSNDEIFGTGSIFLNQYGDNFLVKVIRGDADPNTEDEYIEIKCMTWLTGTMDIDGAAYNFTISSPTAPGYFKELNIDLNNNNNYDDALEGPFVPADHPVINGVQYALSIELCADKFYLTFPDANTIAEDLKAFYASLDISLDYLAIVGCYDTMPFGIYEFPVNNPGEIPEHKDIASDTVYADIDDDSFVEIAVGRIMASDVYNESALIGRSIVYNDLSGPWRDKGLIISNQGDPAGNLPLSEASAKQAQRHFENIGYQITGLYENYVWDDSYLLDKGVIIHSDHGWSDGWWGGPTAADPWILSSPAMAFSGGCNSANIDESNFADSMAITFLDRGGIAYIGSTRISWDYMLNEFLDGLIYKEMNMGQAMKYAENYVEYLVKKESEQGGIIKYPQIVFLEQILYGDPALDLNRPSTPSIEPARVNISQDMTGVLRVEVFGPEQWSDNSILHLRTLFGHFQRTFQVSHIDH
ncbi:hypothetical protein JXL19_03810 [bacterium]|nr:hypothetical protein [bacterium]